MYFPRLRDSSEDMDFTQHYGINLGVIYTSKKAVTGTFENKDLADFGKLS